MLYNASFVRTLTLLNYRYLFEPHNINLTL